MMWVHYDLFSETKGIKYTDLCPFLVTLMAIENFHQLSSNVAGGSTYEKSKTGSGILHDDICKHVFMRL